MARIEEELFEPITTQCTIDQNKICSPHRIFYGRQAVVDNIATLLANERTSRVCITGVGGMGKTSVALAVMESPAVMPSSQRNISFGSLALKRPHLTFSVAFFTHSFGLRLTRMIPSILLSTNSMSPLLLLDNFETHAKLPHVALMVTMTSAFPPSDEVDWRNIPPPSLDRLAACETFTSLYPGTAEAPNLDELLEAIGCIPIAITLMAANGKHSQASPDELLQEWRTAGTNMVSRVDHTISLSVNREIIKSNPKHSPSLLSFHASSWDNW
ncbi:hypothetical protein BDP27DRAFT_1450529 [Rhodocollybia butyracea]|uniref:Uncharacterized protein n=1 Tax=Rhodocollybia butyracea TaxID=206335 RepID=A0A9P5U3S8_9AGAR|nr:hypothetical protein BDP27DRAFT_1450529 [Rhodocollybia butyracea]